MTIARLAGLVMRATAPAARPIAGATLPSFDAPAAIGTAALAASLGEAGPRVRRTVPADQRSLPRVAPRVVPRVVTEATPAAIAVTARPTTSQPHAALATRPVQRHAPEAVPEAVPEATRPHVLSPAVAVPTPRPPLGRVTAQQGEAAMHVQPAPPVAAALPAAAAPERQAPDGPMVAVPVPVNVPGTDRATTAPVADRAAAPHRDVLPAAPSVTIGTVEVVIAPPPQRTPAPPRPTPDRGFARYAAMRAARDRAW